MVKFYGAARAGGVKPIIGADCWLQNDADRDKPFRLLLLCASRAGYLRLCDLLSRAWLRNQHRGRAELARDWLEDTDGLIALSGAAGGDVGQALASDQWRGRRAAGARLGKPVPRPLLRRAAARRPPSCRSAGCALSRACRRLALPVVATHPVQFLDAATSAPTRRVSA